MKFLVSEKNWDIEGYRKNLLSLRSRLSARVYRLVSAVDFHDAKVLQVQITNESATHPGIWKRDPTIVEVSLIPRNGFLYSLRYSGVVRIAMSFDGRLKHFSRPDGGRDYWSEDRHGLDEWAYDEVTAVDREYLSHEIRFHSDAVLELHFRRLTFKRSVRKYVPGSEGMSGFRK
jgi:hypothetical protein